MSNSETDALIKRVDTLTRSLAKSPIAGRQALIDDLKSTTGNLESILNVAWNYCGKNRMNDPAFERYEEILFAYTKGCNVIDMYTGRLT